MPILRYIDKGSRHLAYYVCLHDYLVVSFSAENPSITWVDLKDYYCGSWNDLLIFKSNWEFYLRINNETGKLFLELDDGYGLGAVGLIPKINRYTQHELTKQFEKCGVRTIDVIAMHESTHEYMIIEQKV